MKRILITGANSYIGTSFERYIHEHYPGTYHIDTMDMIGDDWREKSFEGYDCVFHVAGIAHSDNGKLTQERERLYNTVNIELPAAVAEKARVQGVGQFIFMSSAIVYGKSAPFGKTRRITKDTPPSPANCYGDSKLQAEKRILPLANDAFSVVVLRSPMIYGKGCKGNYVLLSKIARKLPLFPRVNNERSMIYVENICEFVRLMIENNENGIFWPQNAEYVNVSDMVKTIAAVHHRKIWITPLFNWALHLLRPFVSVVDKAFGGLVYDASMSVYPKGNYQHAAFEEGVAETES